MGTFKKLAVLAATAEAARRYAKKNPDSASRMLDQAAGFVDKQTKGKYSSQIHDATSKAKGVAGIHPTAPAQPHADAGSPPPPRPSTPPPPTH